MVIALEMIDNSVSNLSASKDVLRFSKDNNLTRESKFKHIKQKRIFRRQDLSCDTV
jgi:hypothetical protein